MIHPGSKTLLALAITSLLAVGCGGGSSSSGDPNPDPDPIGGGDQDPDGDPPAGDDPDGNTPGDEVSEDEDSDQRTWVTVNDSGYRGTVEWDIGENGVFRQTAHVSNRYEATRAYARSFHRGSYLYMKDDDAPDDFEFSTTATLGDEQGLGVMFRYQRTTAEGGGVSESYYRVSISPRWGFTRFEKRVENRWESIAVRAIGHEVGDTIDIRAVGQGPVVMVYIDGEPTFSHSDSALAAGSVALYSQGHATFTDLEIGDAPSAPAVVISNPVSNAVVSHAERNDILTVRAHVINTPGATVEFDLNGAMPALTRVTNSSRTFDARFDPVGSGDREVTATLRDSTGTVVATHTVTNLGVGLHYVTVGDGLTIGSGDRYQKDNKTSDGRMVSHAGFQANIATRLAASEGVPVIVYNEGLPSLKSAQVADQSHLWSVLDRYTDPLSSGDAFRGGDVDGLLVLLGATDVGTKLAPEAFRANIEQLAESGQSSEGNPYRPIHLAYALPVIPGTHDLDPASIDAFELNAAFIGPYNRAIQDVAGQYAHMHVGPDFYSVFRNYPSLYDRSIPARNATAYKHPNSLGNALLGECWAQYLAGAQGCQAPFLLEDLTHGLEQNLVQEGGFYYLDAGNVTMTAIPSELHNGIVLMTRDADKASDAAEYVSFRVPAAARVYVGYAAGTVENERPQWLNEGFDRVEGSTIATSGAADLDLFAQNYAAGATISLGGNREGGVAGGQNNYIVIVVPQ